MMATVKRDYYEVLEVEKTASGDEITKSYRKLAMRYHPDRNHGDAEAEDKFKEATTAYDVLRDPDKRERYDRYGHAGVEGMPGPNFDDLRNGFGPFGDLINSFFGGGGGHRGPQRGQDIHVRVDLELSEAYKGASKSISVAREENCGECSGSGARKGTKPATCKRCDGHGVVVQRQGFFSVQRTCPGCGGRGAVVADPCATCHGEGRVRVKRTLEVAIPPGVDTGNRIQLSGEGEAGEPGGPRGDLFVQVRVREHALFTREGDHLVCRVPVTFSQAALGATIDVPTLDGKKEYELPKGVQSGEVLRIAGKGMPNVRGGRRGDLAVQVVVETPKNLSKRQEELLRELAELDSKHVSPQRKGFLDKVRDFFAAGDSDTGE